MKVQKTHKNTSSHVYGKCRSTALERSASNATRWGGKPVYERLTITYIFIFLHYWRAI